MTARAAEPDPQPSNNTGSTSTSVATGGGADLSLAMTDAPDPVRRGSTRVYTLVLRNAGPAASSGVTVNDALPSSVSFLSATSTKGSCTGVSTMICAVGSMQLGEAVTITISTRARTAGMTLNSASVMATTPDPATTNYAGSSVTTIRREGAATVYLAARPVGRRRPTGKARRLGLVGQIDPPREELRLAVAMCRAARIRPIMVTADHELTGLAIARELGIARDAERAVDGPELEPLGECELRDALPAIAGFPLPLPLLALALALASVVRWADEAAQAVGARQVIGMLEPPCRRCSGLHGRR